MMQSSLTKEKQFGLIDEFIFNTPCLKNQSDDSDEYCIQSLLKSWLIDTATICCARASTAFLIPDEEREIVAHAVPKRQAEFIAARWCAHRALELIGRPAECIPMGELGGPQWPTGISGSISHESGICLAVVARESQFKGIGVDIFDKHRDVEIIEISELILSEAERELCRTPADNASCLMLAFSAKEAVVKAVSGYIGRFLDMREIRLSIEAHSFNARIAGFPHEIWGMWGSAGSFFLTLAVLADEKRQDSKFDFRSGNGRATSSQQLAG